MATIAPAIENEEDLQSLYNWVDETPLSRPKRNIARDFADGVLFAEILNNHFPRLVDMHNYSAANSHTQKLTNWNTLNAKVLKKIGYTIHPQDVDDICRAVPDAIERVLRVLQEKVIQVQEGQLKYRAPVASVVPRVAVTPPAQEQRGHSGRSGLGHSPGPHPGSRGNREARSAAEKYQHEVDAELLLEKEQTIAELREMTGIMSEKIKKLEQLVRIKDAKIDAMGQKLQKYGLA